MNRRVSAYCFPSMKEAHLVVLSVLEKLSDVVTSDNTSLHVSKFGQFPCPRVLGLKRFVYTHGDDRESTRHC